MKANLRINFKRICFDAKISRQRGSTKKKEKENKNLGNACHLAH